MQPVNSLIVYDVNLAVQQAKQASEIVRILRAEVLRQDIDYGVIPGTGKKPSLLKPGAERLCSAFGLSPEFEIVSKVEEWNPEHPMFNYQYRCRLVHIDSGKTVATGIGSCNSMESKYRWRNSERVCPNCGQPAIIKGKEEFGGGWLCYKAKGGCGSKFGIGFPQIADQQVGKVENKDIFDQVNTLDKMAQKRSLIAATLIGCNASEFFTQDVEDIKSFAVTDDVIDAEVIEDQPPAQQTTPQPAEPPRQQTKSGNGHQAWYGVPENVKTIKSWLADRELTMDAAVKLVGKPLTEFSTGSAFTDAVTAAIGKPAQPKNPPKPEEPEPHWSQKGEEIAALADFLTRFDDMRTAEAMKRLKVDTWRVYATRDAAQEAIRKIAFEQCWNMRAYAVKYEPKDSGGSVMTFETPLPVVWFAGRHELIEAVAEAQKNWQEILVWEKAGTYTLPEPVRIEVAVKGDHLEITHIVSAVGIPF